LDPDNLFDYWWKKKTKDSFKERAECLIQQYSNYTVRKVNQTIDGWKTLGENISDNGGINMAFRAYKKWLSTQGQHPEVLELEQLPGLNVTNTQLFFLSFAQTWCSAKSKNVIKHLLETDVHSPDKFRVIGSLSNSKDFARAYNCPIGTKMNPQTKCSIW
jgi:neprilysin